MGEVRENRHPVNEAFMVPDREDGTPEAEAEEVADDYCPEIVRPVRYAEDCDAFGIEKKVQEISFQSLSALIAP
jgi:hypothetical protein